MPLLSYSFLILQIKVLLLKRGGAHPKKNQSLHQNRQIGIGFFLVFLVFFGFLKFPNWHWFFFGFFLALVLARIRNWKLVFFWFFWVFLVFFGFFWLKLWPTFEIGNCFFGFFWYFLVFLGFFGFFFGI